MKNRILAYLLCVLMLVGMVPVSVSAAVDAATAEAQIGSTYYATLQEAVDAAKNGETVKLLKDVTYSKANGSINGSWVDGLVYTGDQSFTIDLGGNMIMDTAEINDYLVYFKNMTSTTPNEITLTNGTIMGTAGKLWNVVLVGAQTTTAATTVNFASGIKIISTDGNDGGEDAVIRARFGGVLNVMDGATILSRGDADHCINVAGYYAGKPPIANIYEGAVITQNNVNGIAVTGNGIVNVNGGTITSEGYGLYTATSGEPVFNVYNGTISANKGAVVAAADVSSYAGANPTINVAGGTIDGSIGEVIYGNVADQDAIANVIVTGGSFTVDPTDYFPAGSNNQATENNGSYVVAPAANSAASIGNVGYATLADAVAAAKTGDTVKVLDNIALTSAGRVIVTDKAVTIEADKAVNITANGFADAFEAKQTGVITLGKNLTITSNSNGILWAIEGGKIYVDGANVRTTDVTNTTACAKHEGSLIELKSGSITGEKGGALAAKESGSVVISGGEVSTTNTTRLSAVYTENGTITVTGGTVTAPDTVGAVVASVGGKIIVEGGEMTSVLAHFNSGTAEISDGKIGVVYNCNGAGTVTITGGEITTIDDSQCQNAQCPHTGDKKMTISGGIFTNKPSENYIAEGSTVVEKDGKYVVSKPHTCVAEWVNTDSTEHWKVCATCGIEMSEKEPHEFDENGVCECGARDSAATPVPDSKPTFDYVLFALAARYAQKYDVIVTADNATVTGDMAIKYKRNGTVDIAAADGYKVVDVIANGISLGVVDSVTFKQVKAPQTLVVVTEKLYTNPYSDIADDNAAVQYVTENGLMAAVEEGKFDPEGLMTRGDMANILYVLAGSPEVDATVTVNDSEDPAVLWAASMGILTPDADGLVAADATITLADLNAMLNAYAGTTDVAYIELDAETADIVGATRIDVAEALYAYANA